MDLHEQGSEAAGTAFRLTMGLDATSEKVASPLHDAAEQWRCLCSPLRSGFLCAGQAHAVQTAAQPLPALAWQCQGPALCSAAAFSPADEAGTLRAAGAVPAAFVLSLYCSRGLVPAAVTAQVR